ncbi:MAG: hypothetical protein SGPRY_005896, partial [Prymnesium sp.]
RTWRTLCNGSSTSSRSWRSFARPTTGEPQDPSYKQRVRLLQRQAVIRQQAATASSACAASGVPGAPGRAYVQVDVISRSRSAGCPLALPRGTSSRPSPQHQGRSSARHPIFPAVRWSSTRWKRVKKQIIQRVKRVRRVGRVGGRVRRVRREMSATTILRPTTTPRLTRRKRVRRARRRIPRLPTMTWARRRSRRLSRVGAGT